MKKAFLCLVLSSVVPRYAAAEQCFDAANDCFCSSREILAVLDGVIVGVSDSTAQLRIDKVWPGPKAPADLTPQGLTVGAVVDLYKWTSERALEMDERVLARAYTESGSVKFFPGIPILADGTVYCFVQHDLRLSVADTVDAMFKPFEECRSLMLQRGLVPEYCTGSGCGCSTPASAGGTALLFVLLAVGAGRARRRPR